MMTKYQSLFVAYLVVIGGPLLNIGIQPAFGQDHKSRQTRSNKFIEGPNGHLCILNQEGGGDKRYDIISEDGTMLTCDVCAIGKVLVSNCTSDRLTECRLLKSGKQRMPHPNICTSGYPCKTCSGPSQTVKTPCNPYGREDNTECQCAEGYYSTNHEADMCNPLPRCSEGFEPRPGAGAGGVAEKICQKCGDGFHQPNDNSTELCRKHTDCIETPGTDVSDNICKGDPQSSGSPATSPSEGAPSVPPTLPSTQVSSGPTSPTSEGTTVPPDQTVDHITNNVAWYIGGAICTHVFCFIAGIVFSNYWKKKKGCFWRPKGNIKATSKESTELQPIRGTSSGSDVVNMPSSDKDAPTEQSNVTDLTTKKRSTGAYKKTQAEGW